MADDAGSLVRDCIEAVFNRGEADAAARFLAPGFRSTNPNFGEGPAGFQAFAESIRGAVEGFRGEVVDLLAEEGRVAARVRWTGRHAGAFLGAEPSGRAVDYESVEFFRVEDGRITEHSDVVDRLAFLAGFGLADKPQVEARSAAASPQET